MKVKVKSLSHVRLFETPMDCSLPHPPSMGFSKQGYWSGLPFPFPEDLPDPGIEPRSPGLQTDFFLSELQGSLSLMAQTENKTKQNRIFEKC